MDPGNTQSLVPALAEESDEEVVACWEALAAVTGSIPKEMQPNYVRCLKVRYLRSGGKGGRGHGESACAGEQQVDTRDCHLQVVWDQGCTPHHRLSSAGPLHA